MRKGGLAVTSNRLSTFPVRRDDLTITVTEGGSTKASQTIDIKSEVYGEATIISLIPEGTYITQEDVNNGKLLVELESSGLKDRLKEEEKGLANDEARLIEVQENYHIQLNQNESDITAAKLAVKFALMDLQKYLGETVAQKVVEKASLDPNSNFDMTSLLANNDPNDPNSLSGGSSQQLKQLKDAILLAKGQLEKANDVLEGTQKLHDANYVSELELKGAKLDVHETSVDKVRPGQHAIITVDAFPDKTFQGEVIKVAPLPDPQQGFLNPDVKVYTTKVSMKGSHDSVRPGMSAKVEILVDQLDDVLIVPVQTVAIREGKKLCYVMASDTPQPRVVSTGAFNDTFVEIISGLEEGEQVLLNPPLLIEPSAVAKLTEEHKLPPGDTLPKAEPRAGIAKDASGVEK